MDCLRGIGWVGIDFADVKYFVDIFLFLPKREREWAFAELEEIEFLSGLEHLGAGFVFFLVVAVVEKAVVEGVLVIDLRDTVVDLFLFEVNADAGVVLALSLKDAGAGVGGGFAG